MPAMQQQEQQLVRYMRDGAKCCVVHTSMWPGLACTLSSQLAPLLLMLGSAHAMPSSCTLTVTHWSGVA